MNKQISDQQFLKKFENHSLDDAYFDHLGHLRIAWLYLCEYDIEVAIEKVCTGISTYAESLGASTKFNFTLTHAIVMIMAKRLAKLKDNSWENFLLNNNDLVTDILSVLDEFYSRDVLFSELAKKTLIAPDIHAI